MAAFKTLLSGLRRAEQELEKQLGSVRSAIASLAGGGSTAKRGPGRPASGKKRKMSAKARKAISDAQKKRWAKQKSAKK